MRVFIKINNIILGTDEKKYYICNRNTDYAHDGM
jgi:hypothetical protein